MPLPSNTGGSSKAPFLNRNIGGKTQGGAARPAPLNFSPVANPGIKMGNGASASSVTTADGEIVDIVKLKSLVPELRKEIKIRDSKLLRYETELLEKSKLLDEKCIEVTKLKAEVDKLQSVLQIKVHKNIGNGKFENFLTIQEDAALPSGQIESRTKKQGVSGESPGASQNGANLEIKHVEKDFRYVLFYLVHVHVIYYLFM